MSGQALKSNEDALDAIICLYIAGLYAIGFQGQVFGDKSSGYIWVPGDVCIDLERIKINPDMKGLKLENGLLGQVDVSNEKRISDDRGMKNVSRITPRGSRAVCGNVINPGLSKVCPACGMHTFKRWPFGWDAHAAHRCAGLKSVGIEARKAEFKSRFDYLFK